MKVLLISPNREHLPDPAFPLGLAYIASALMRHGHAVPWRRSRADSRVWASCTRECAQALYEALRLASEVNKYLDTAAPWFEIKSDKAAAAKTVYTALRCIDSLKTLLSPVLPFSSERLHTFLGYTTPLFGEQYIETVQDSLGTHNGLRYRAGHVGDLPYWKPSELKPGQKLNQPGPLLKKLEESVVEEERARLGK